MSCPTALYCVRHKTAPQVGGVPITVTPWGHTGGDGALCIAPADVTGVRFVTSRTLAEVSKKPAASVTVSMLREGRAGQSDSITGRKQMPLYHSMQTGGHGLQISL